MVTYVVRDTLEPPAELVLRDQIYRLRNRVFNGRLKWEVDTEAGRERDEFDDIPQVYACTLDQYDRVVGTWRLLPTTGPYMLRDVFPDLLHGHDAPCSPNVWEVSRFAVAAHEDSWSAAEEVAIMRELVTALFRFGHENGISRIVAVTDLRFERLLGRCGLSTTRYGPPVDCGVTKAVAGYADVEPAYIETQIIAAERGLPEDPAERRAVA
jgi:acyl homoserine lactone synthase